MKRTLMMPIDIAVTFGDRCLATWNSEPIWGYAPRSLFLEGVTLDRWNATDAKCVFRFTTNVVMPDLYKSTDWYAIEAAEVVPEREGR